MKRDVRDQRIIIIQNALDIVREIKSQSVFLFLNAIRDCRWYLKSALPAKEDTILVVPSDLKIQDAEFKKAQVKTIRSWSGNQSRFSRIKYAFLKGVLQHVILPESRVVCILGPWGKSHLDTITIHDLAHSWSEDFPLDVKSLITKRALHVVMAVVDIALDIGALGREGKSVGTTFVIGDTENVMNSSHQAVFNPFRGYPKKERKINLPEVVESIKELAKLDGAFIITDNGIVEAAGRHLDAASAVTKQLRGLGARHRAAAGISRRTAAVSVVVSESTGRATIFDRGRIAATLEPVISTRLE